jgi:hypothetical protein
MTSKILSIDVDYCLTSSDFIEVQELFCKNLFKIKEKENILFSQYHVDILDLCLKCKGDLEVSNIDMHHDVFYQAPQSTAEIRNGISDSSNWVGWLAVHQPLKKYTWYKQPFSDEFSDELVEAFHNMYDKSGNYDIVDARNLIFNSKMAITELKNEHYLKQKPKIEVETRIKKYLFDIDFDYLFVCLSPEYTPKEHYYMYESLKSIKEEFFKSLGSKKNIQNEGEA